MQYLLSEEEFKLLSAQAVRGRKYPSDEDLQKFCTRIANEMPIQLPWGNPKWKTPWGCILTSKSEYCDECPAKGLCRILIRVGASSC
jgi:hypothetical protein